MFLVAITSASQGCELQALDVRDPWCKIRDFGCELWHNPDFLPKVASVENINATIDLPRLRALPGEQHGVAWACLCVTRALEEYIFRTKGHRQSDQLFVCYGKDKLGLPAHKTTIARWISDAISVSYEIQGKVVPENIHAHSTRSTSASTAYGRGVDFSEIARAARWATRSTFVTHYKLHQATEGSYAFARAVLRPQ